jgi:hypothetical protein
VTANRSITCSCGETFTTRGGAEAHAYVWRNQPDAHTIVEETPGPDERQAIPLIDYVTTLGGTTPDPVPHFEPVSTETPTRRLTPAQLDRELAAGLQGAPDPHVSAAEVAENMRRVRLDEIMHEIVAARTEIIVEATAMEDARITAEAARGRYEAARHRLENADHALEALLRERVAAASGAT